jgi:hypothetical protein
MGKQMDNAPGIWSTSEPDGNGGTMKTAENGLWAKNIF